MAEYKIPIPHASQSAFLAHKGRSIQNAGLIFDRFVPDTKDDSKLKADGLQAVLSAFEKADKDLLKEWNTRWEQTVHAAEAESFPMQTDWRLIAGLGKKGSLEVGFTFHRYGFPYLPGSSLKGVARAYGLLEIAVALETVIKARNEKDPVSRLDEILSYEDTKKFEDGIQSYEIPNSDVLEMAKGFRQVFGTSVSAGKTIFFDGIPSAKFPLHLELDIMNPHYPDYYKEMGTKEPKEYPTNWQSPIPIQFLTVASGSVFRFAIGWRKSTQDSAENSEKKETKWNGWFKGEQIKKESDKNAPRLIKLARRWLQGGLLELGAGGKTSAGYGYFSEATKE